MSQRELIGFIIGLLIVLPLTSFVGKYLALWLGSIRVTFVRMLISTSIAYLLTFVISSVMVSFGKLTPDANGLRVLAGWGILAACHANFLRSPGGDRLSPIKSIFVAALQVIGGTAAFLLVLLLILALKRLST
jgi:hypothetical protein